MVRQYPLHGCSGESCDIKVDTVIRKLLVGNVMSWVIGGEGAV